MSTAAERAAEFAQKAYDTFTKASAERGTAYEAFQAADLAYNEASAELEWAKAHPALPEGWSPVEHDGKANGGEEKPAPKRRGRPRKTAEPKPEPEALTTTPAAATPAPAPVQTGAAPAGTAEAQATPTSPEPVYHQTPAQAAPQFQQPASPQTGYVPPAAPVSDVSDPFDPFAN